MIWDVSLRKRLEQGKRSFSLDVQFASDAKRLVLFGPSGAKSTINETRLTPASPADGLTDEFLGQVAAAYRAAVARGERPNKALAEQSGYPPRTAERWVYLARKKGLLAPTRPGSVG